jgi:hypothetical protein
MKNLLGYGKDLGSNFVTRVSRVSQPNWYHKNRRTAPKNADVVKSNQTFIK